MQRSNYGKISMSFIKEISQKQKLYLNKQNFYSLMLIILILFIDRISKLEIINYYSDHKIYINYFINFNLVWNTGIGFGLFSTDTSLIYNIITVLIAVVIIILFYVTINSDNLDKLIFTIIIGGALGNFYDRVIYSAVPDFIDIHFNNFHWFTFNFADIFISLGIIFFLIKDVFKKNA
jgi:signal peptidase II